MGEDERLANGAELRYLETAAEPESAPEAEIYHVAKIPEMPQQAPNPLVPKRPLPDELNPKFGPSPFNQGRNYKPK